MAQAKSLGIILDLALPAPSHPIRPLSLLDPPSNDKGSYFPNIMTFIYFCPVCLFLLS